MAVSFFSLIMLASTALADIDVGCDAGNASSGECFDAAPKQPRAGTAMMQVKANPSSQDFASTVLLEQAHAKVNKKPPSIPGKDPVKFYQTWAMDPPVEEGNFEYVYYGKKDGQLGALATPHGKCPSTGWPALVIMPGLSATAPRIQWIGEMLASLGIVTLSLNTPNTGKRMLDSSAARKWFLQEGVSTYCVDANDIAVLGYSEGGRQLLEATLNGVEAWSKIIVVSGGTANGDNPDAPPLLVMHAIDDYQAGKEIDSAEGAFKRQQRSGAYAAMVKYAFGGHFPMGNSDFIYQIHKFLVEGANYVAPTVDTLVEGTLAYNGRLQAEWAETSNDEATLSCVTNDDGIKPLAKANLWSTSKGEECCRGFCTATKGCKVAIMTKAPDFSSQQKPNCYLYADMCTTPTYTGGGATWEWVGGPPDINARALLKPPPPTPPPVPKVWETISLTAACGNPAKLFKGYQESLEDCKAECEKVSTWCVAIDYFRDSNWCNGYNEACESPTKEKSGASSYKYVES